jgi:hypothetical protein
VVRRDEADRDPQGERASSCCASPAGESPAPVSVGAPASRPPVPGEIPATEAGRQEGLRTEQARGPQHQVKLAASKEKQSGSRVAHVTAKATSAAHVPKRVVGPGGVWSAARVQGEVRNSGDPSALPRSGQGAPYKPKAKSAAAQRESEGVVVPSIVAQNNATGGKGLCFGHAREEGKREGMAGKTGPNHPDGHTPSVQARQPRRELWVLAKWWSKRHASVVHPIGNDTPTVARERARGAATHALPRRPSVSRVREIRTHGLKGGPAPSRVFTHSDGRGRIYQ